MPIADIAEPSTMKKRAAEMSRTQIERKAGLRGEDRLRGMEISEVRFFITAYPEGNNIRFHHLR